METKIKSLFQLDRSNFTLDPSLSGKYEKAINSPDVIRMREELRAITSKVKGFPK
ncbi:hypothetical protein VB796_09795 [Arcicella sp. LKC2W]|jgi:hypothetical protein|uniref:hypothetical protein n=1 Tax=Arcicella sp. LKC2W TaxID=2984198 RepID=UPI002B214186|nr:hypothetical protein [Arcicella sp. LKC2W]MEA5459331.1 hypothetical protein [Arcicella sp. LKC2W]